MYQARDSNERTDGRADKSQRNGTSVSGLGRGHSARSKIVIVVTQKPVITKYFCPMDPSVHYLLGNDVPTTEGATIHSIVSPTTIEMDDDKIGFTLDVAMRLDREQASGDAHEGVVIPLSEMTPEDLADSA
jgi:hypothetical protein